MKTVRRLVAIALIVVALAVPAAGVAPAHAELVWTGHSTPMASWAGCSHDASGCPQ